MKMRQITERKRQKTAKLPNKNAPNCRMKTTKKRPNCRIKMRQIAEFKN
jgi:hypothetical protein